MTGVAPDVTSAGSRSRGVEQNVGAVVIMLGVVVLLWLATRPYLGVIHDSRFYTLLALRMADPARLDPDLFLHFGRQDRFSVFSYLYEPVLVELGVGRGAMVMTAIGQACWLAGAFSLATSLTHDRVRALVAVAGLIILPSAYGPRFIISFGEPFVTPRLFAEAASMVALGYLVRGRLMPAAAALCVSGAFHPIMAIAGAAVFLLYAGRRNSMWYAAAIGASAVCIALAFLGVEPFTRLGVRLDPEWFQVVYQREETAFLSRWTAADYIVLVSEVSLALVVLRKTGPDGRRLLWAVLTVMSGGLVLNGVGADLLHNQLLTNLQFWRTAWMLEAVSHLLATAAVIAMWDENAHHHPFARPLVIAGVLFLFAARFVATFYIEAAFLLAWGAIYIRRYGLPSSKPLHPSLLPVAIIIGIVSATFYSIFTNVDTTQPALDQRWLNLNSFVLCLLAFGVAVRLTASKAPANRLIFATLAVLLLSGIAGIGFDNRTDWARYSEDSNASSRELKSFIPDGSNVYWDGMTDVLWLRLRHASYYSCSQGAGGMFFRETAIAFAHRYDSFRFEPLRNSSCSTPGQSRPVQTSEAELRRACAREPELDYIIVPNQISGLPTREWTSPVEHFDYHLQDDTLVTDLINHYYRYTCSDLRTVVTSEPSSPPSAH